LISWLSWLRLLRLLSFAAEEPAALPGLNTGPVEGSDPILPGPEPIPPGLPGEPLPPPVPGPGGPGMPDPPGPVPSPPGLRGDPLPAVPGEVIGGIIGGGAGGGMKTGGGVGGDGILKLAPIWPRLLICGACGPTPTPSPWKAWTVAGMIKVKRPVNVTAV